MHMESRKRLKRIKRKTNLKNKMYIILIIKDQVKDKSNSRINVKR